MTKTDDLKRLEEVLEIYGPDATRWPADECGRLEELAANEPAGRRLLAEARALAEVMAHAPEGVARRELRMAILAAAMTAGNGRGAAKPASLLEAAWRWFGGESGLAAAWQPAVMAAALALGVYLGVSGLTQPVFEQAVTMASLDSVAAETENLFAADDAETLGEENSL